MDFKEAIDNLAWIRSQEEIDAGKAMRKAIGSDEWEKAYQALSAVLTDPPLRETGLEHAVFYAFQARAAWEILNLADEHGEELEELYNLHPAGQGGIGLNWDLLSERIWIPAPYFTNIAEGAQSILSHDERNCLRPSYEEHPEYKELSQVLNGLSEAKIGKLLTDSEYRASAREYCKALLDCTRRYMEDEIKPEFIPVFQAMHEAYQSEMI